MIFLFCRTCQTRLTENGSSHVCYACGADWRTVGGVLRAATAPSGNQSGASEEFFDRYHTVGKPVAPSETEWWFRLDSLDPARILDPLISSTLPKVVIELGCGAGTNLASVQAVHPHVALLIGCDVSYNALSLAKTRLSNERSASNVLLIHADGTQLPLEPQCADIVLLINVLHHATDLSLIGDAARLVRLGGTVLVIDLSSKSFLNRASRLVWGLFPRSLRRRFAHDLLVDDEAPTVQLVNPDILDSAASQAGMVREGGESMGLFLFIIQHFFMLFPNLGRWFPKNLWIRLEWLERRALDVPFLANQCTGFSIRYRMGQSIPIAP